MNINGNHWALLVLNFIKKEVRIHESLGIRNEELEKTMVSMYQFLSMHLQENYQTSHVCNHSI
jgi:hypothetical protein